MPDPVAPAAVPVVVAPVVPAAEPEPLIPPIQTPLEADDAADAPGAPVAVPAVVAAPAVPAAPVVAAPPAPDPPKLVPIGAVHEERTKRQRAEERLQQSDPIIAALHANPDLVAALQARINGAPVTPTTEQETKDLTEIATDLVLYKPDGSGKLDLEAARRVRDRQLATTEAIVEKALTKAGLPKLRETVQQRTASERRALIEHAAAGQGVSAAMLGPILDSIHQSDPTLLDQPEVGAIAILLAKGMGAPVPGAPAAVAAVPAPAGSGVAPTTAIAPIVTDAPGSRAVAQPEIPRILSRIAKRKGWSQERVAKTFGKMGAEDTRHIAMEKED